MTFPEDAAGDSLAHALITARLQDARREHAAAARTLDAALNPACAASAALRFQALVLRADLAVSLDALGEALGILAEAKQVPLGPSDRESLGSDLRRVDDLEVFLTHRGCAG